MASPVSFVPINWTILTGNTPVDALLSEVQYVQTSGQPLNLSFSFPYVNGVAVWTAGYGQGETASSTALNTAQQQAVRDALQAWANVANISFTEVTETSTTVGDMRFAFADLPDTVAAWAYLPWWVPESGDVWLNNDAAAMSWGTGTWNYLTLLHEIGHALGLRHPHEADGSNTIIMPSNLDSVLYTVMSYNEPTGTTNPWWNTSTIVAPMLYDIAAIQHLFGANMSYRTGNDLYSMSAALGQRFNTTIWDAGGIDTLDISAYELSQSLSLTPGSDEHAEPEPGSHEFTDHRFQRHNRERHRRQGQRYDHWQRRR